MPLILHPSSCCDVCLEPFTESNPRPPHAIPCGHIFCRECLLSMNPSTCPFCRRAYLPDRIKKLITSDRGAHDDMSEDLLLHRILANWYVQAELAISKTEAENWLNSRPNNANLPIKRILEILDNYETLKSQAEKYQMRARRMKHQLRRHEQVAIYEKDTAQAVEHSLQEKLDELGAKSTRYEAEIQRLRREVDSFRNRNNPLPRPPEPVEVQPVPPLPAGAFTFSPSDFPYRLTDTSDVDDDRTHGPYFYISEDEDGHEVYHVLSRPPSPSKIPKSREERDRLLYDIHRYPPPKRSYIPGAVPGERVIPKKDALEPRPFDGFWPNPNGDTGLELHFDHNPNTTLPAAWTNGTGYRPGQPPKPFPAPAPLLGAVLPPTPPSQSSHSSSSHSHRSRGEGQAAQLAELLSDPTSQFRSATSHQRHKRGNPWPLIEDAALPPGFQPIMHSVGAILSPNTSSALTQSVASLMENMSVDQSSNQSRPPPSSAPASTSTSSYRSSQSFISDDSSMHRPRPRRRSTARTMDGSNPMPPDDASQTSSRHRRQSAAPDAAHANGYMHIAHMRTDAVETGSVLVERQSIDSWGTVDSRNPPLRRRPSTLNSVQDMPLVTFAADASRRAMIHSDTSSLLSPSLANPFANSGAGLQAPHQSQPQTDRQTMEGESADRHPDNSTPRSGSLTALVAGASAAVVYPERPSGSSSRANDRERHEHEHQRQHRRSSSGWPNSYNTSSLSLSRPGSSHHSIASSGESGASGAQAPQSHRSHGRHSRSVSLATVTPVTMNGNGTPDARYTNPSRSSNDSRYWNNSTNGTRVVADNSAARRAIPLNALGLEIRDTPPVDERPPLSAPTPVVAAQSFLRSFSNGGEF